MVVVDWGMGVGVDWGMVGVGWGMGVRVHWGMVGVGWGMGVDWSMTGVGWVTPEGLGCTMVVLLAQGFVVVVVRL